ncbi:Methionine aminopeptidase [Buchnera aphidicola (Anoecia corni)]|uniref:Methionine aminopeptidase n=1 Tax=Buchnera aphidicola (Anoecia corni) TaxID=2994477 RepID=A0AAT9IFY7_9GAMM
MTSTLIKTSQEIKKMRIAGKLTSEVLNMIEPFLIPGISTGEIDRICHNFIIKQQKAIPACLGYNGFPNSICTSINDVVCHGIPSYTEYLKEGDIINIDVAVIKNGYHGDASKMFIIGNTTKQLKKLCRIAENSLSLALEKIKPGVYSSIIGKTIQKYVESNKFSVVRNYCGHGIGKMFHEKPEILHFYNKKIKGIKIKKNMTFTVEPMINIGSHNVQCMQDGWTVKTIDHSYSAQYEHTVLVTEYGCEILTL